jgi:hypothetical protein
MKADQYHKSRRRKTLLFQGFELTLMADIPHPIVILYIYKGKACKVAMPYTKEGQRKSQMKRKLSVNSKDVYTKNRGPPNTVSD